MYAVFHKHLCDCGELIVFLGQGQTEVRDHFRDIGICAYSSEDGEVVTCPTCGMVFYSPIPELLDADRHPLGRMLRDLDHEYNGGK